MANNRDLPKMLQIGSLVLLTIAIAQVAWWIADQVSLARHDRDDVAALYQAEASAANAIANLLRSGSATPDEAALEPGVSEANAGDVLPAVLATLRSHLPQLRIDDTGNAVVRPEFMAALTDASTSRINRYAWEGGFFLLVLVGGMIVLTRAIRHDAQLRRRQQTFLAAVSHEFKSPLASMRLSAETLALRSADADCRRLGQRLLNDGERLLNMVDNLLDTTRIEDGELELRPQALPLAAVVGAACERIADDARAHDVAIHANVDDAIRLFGDQAAFETVLRNLLDNALKACIAGNGQRIAIDAERIGENVEIKVADDGIGFPADAAQAIFGKFYRAPQSRMPGTGLGLYIVHRLAALSGASIAAASEGAGKGAAFTIRWPAAS